MSITTATLLLQLLLPTLLEAIQLFVKNPTTVGAYLTILTDIRNAIAAILGVAPTSVAPMNPNQVTATASTSVALTILGLFLTPILEALQFFVKNPTSIGNMDAVLQSILAALNAILGPATA